VAAEETGCFVESKGVHVPAWQLDGLCSAIVARRGGGWKPRAAYCSVERQTATGAVTATNSALASGRARAGRARQDDKRHLTEGRQWCTRVLCKAGAEERTRERADVLNAAGVLSFFQRDYPVARALHEESLAIHRELGKRPRRPVPPADKECPTTSQTCTSPRPVSRWDRRHQREPGRAQAGE